MLAKLLNMNKTKKIISFLSIVLLLSIGIFLIKLPNLVKHELEKSLFDLGYSEVLIEQSVWSSQGLGLSLSGLKAKGDKLPPISVQSAVVYIQPWEIFQNHILLHLSSNLLNGQITIDYTDQVWNNKKKLHIDAKNISLAQLLNQIPNDKNETLRLLVERQLDANIDLSATTTDNFTLETIPAFSVDTKIQQIRWKASTDYPTLDVELLTIQSLIYTPNSSNQPRLHIKQVNIEKASSSVSLKSADNQSNLLSLQNIQFRDLSLTQDNSLAIANINIASASILGGINNQEPKKNTTDYAALDIKLLTIQSLIYSPDSSNETLLHINQVDIEKASSSVPSESVGNKSNLFSLQNTQLHDISLTQSNSYVIEAISADSANIAGVINKQGQWADWQAWIKAIFPFPAASGKKDNTPLVLVLKKTHVQNISFDFIDLSKKPEIKMPFLVQTFDASTIRLGGNEIHTSQWNTKGLIGKQGRWAAEGEFTTNKPQLETNMHLSIQNLGLSELSGYAASSFGKTIRSGNVNLDTTIHVSANTLQAKGNIFAKKLSMENVDSFKLSSDKFIPIDTSLDILRDSDDNISIDFSTEGALDDPSFELGGIWDKVIAKSAQKSAVYLLTQALQPYALILTAGQFLYDQTKRINLKSITFKSTDSQLKNATPDVEAYSQKISALMLKRKTLILEICPFFTQEESASLNISDERAEKLNKRMLELDIPQNRITQCLPTLDDSKKGNPRLELRLI